MFAFIFYSAVSDHNLSVHANAFRIAFTVLLFYMLAFDCIIFVLFVFDSTFMFAFNFHSAVSDHNLSVHAHVFRIALQYCFFSLLTKHMNVCLSTCCRMPFITRCILCANLLCKICRFKLLLQYCSAFPYVAF